MTFAIGLPLREYLDRLKGSDFEKNIPFMYVDTTGNVTVGVGHNLTAAGGVQKLPFHVARLTRKAVRGGDVGKSLGEPERIGRKASAEEQQNDYDFLMSHPGLGKYAPEQLAAYTTLELFSDAILNVFERDLQAAIRVVRREFGEPFDHFPVPCQAGLIDIAFNCGGFETFRGHFVPAIKGEGNYAGKLWKERWTIASEHSRRGAVNEKRNAQVAEWFLRGAHQSFELKQLERQAR